MKQTDNLEPSDFGVNDTELLRKIIYYLIDPQIEVLRQELPEGSPERTALEDRIARWRRDSQTMDPESFRRRILQEIRSNSRFNTSFFAELDELMQRRGIKDSDLYNAIGISQPLWSNIKNRGLKDYGKKIRNAHTKKENVLKMAIVLRADYYELYDLMCYGGFSFSPTVNPTDHVVAACIRAGIYDPYKIDNYLVEAGEEALFSEM